MPSIALTGGFGTGKTTVLRMFGNLGALVVNIDSIVHDILQDTDIIKQIGEVLGERVLHSNKNGISVNHKRVADIIFNNTHKRESVERLIHPRVLRIVRNIMKETFSKQPSALIVFEIPLLFEAGFKKHVDYTVVVFCNKKTALMRLELKGFSRDDSEKRMRAQLPMSFKKKEADFLIDNNNGTEKTEARVRRIFDKLSVMK